MTRVIQRTVTGKMVEVDTKPEILTKELMELVGLQSDPVIIEIERGAIRRYADAIEDPNPLYNDVEYARKSKYGDMVCPPGFFGCPVEPREKSLDSPFSRVRNIVRHLTPTNNGGEIEFMLPIRTGDTLTSVSKIVDIYEEIGRSGNRLLLVIFEITYQNQNGNVVAKAYNRGMYY